MEANNLIFYAGGYNSPTLMKISKEGVWINPDIKIDEVARQVFDALGQHFQHSWKIARNEALEEAAKECGLSSVGLHFAAAIRALVRP